MTYVEALYLVDAGQGRWVVNRRADGVLAGTIMLTTKGFILRDDESRMIGSFANADAAMRGLHATSLASARASY